MADEKRSNTAAKHPSGKPFVKGDPRINRRGRPKSFDALRALAQQIAAEIGATGSDGKPHTNVDMALRRLMIEDPEKFLWFAYGKPPNNVDVTSGGEKLTIEIVRASDAKRASSDQ